jgi:hypothetical protein
VLFKFDLTRALYNRVNWDKFPAQNLLKIATNFAVGPAIDELMKERQGAGEKKRPTSSRQGQLFALDATNPNQKPLHMAEAKVSC